jgi:hypothetical protein
MVLLYFMSVTGAHSSVHCICSLGLLILFLHEVVQMAHGGTNFGFYNGANTGQDESDYKADLTSYDYVSITPNNFFHLLILFRKSTYFVTYLLCRMHRLRSMEMCIMQNTKACFFFSLKHAGDLRAFILWREEIMIPFTQPPHLNSETRNLCSTSQVKKKPKSEKKKTP